MDTTELIANQFRMSQTREKLKGENIRNQRDAMETHEMVGKKVRTAIEEIGGTFPETSLLLNPLRKWKSALKHLND